MDDDPVLRSLGADLERDDPGLAAYLSGRAPSPHRHSAAWMLLALPLLLPALLLPARVTLGLIAVLLILASPRIACWLCESGRGPGHPPHLTAHPDATAVTFAVTFRAWTSPSLPAPRKSPAGCGTSCVSTSSPPSRSTRSGAPPAATTTTGSRR